MKKPFKPRAFAEATKDTRFAGTFEVLVPIEGRNKPHRVAQQFPTLAAAEAWLHSPEGIDAIEELTSKARK